MKKSRKKVCEQLDNTASLRYYIGVGGIARRYRQRIASWITEINNMKQNVYEIDFVRAFEESCYNKNFSRKGLVALFAHLEELEAEIGEEIELDLVAIASDFTEYSNWGEIERDFNNIITPEMSPESKLKALEKHINEIVVVDLDEGDIIFHSF